MSKGLRGVTTAFGLAPLLLAMLSCAPGGSSLAAAPDTVEVREYRGERLGSRRDFRENSIRGPQQVDSASYTLTVDGLVRDTLKLALHELLALPQESRVVTLYCVEGWEGKVLWTGLRIMALLDSAGVDSAANTAIFHAVEGYTTSLSLDVVRDRDLLLAHEMNGAPLLPERGYPFQLVAEDKWGYKWIKWVDRIELSADSSYKGFWEKKGYNNNGDQDGPIRENR